MKIVKNSLVFIESR